MSSYVAVIGPSEASDDERADAEAVGRVLAERGHVVLCGGHGGVMGRACSPYEVLRMRVPWALPKAVMGRAVGAGGGKVQPGADVPIP